MSNKQCLFGNDGHQTWPLSFSHHHLSFPPPPTMLITADNNACHHHHPSWLPMNANDHQWPQCHHDWPKNEDGHPQMTTNTHPTNDGLDPQTDTGSDKPRWVNLPLLALHFVHMEYRCHIMVSDVAAKQWTMMTSFVIVLNLGYHSEYCPNSPRWDTGWWQWCDVDTRWPWGHKTRMWLRQEAMRTCDEDTRGQDDEDTWRQQHTQWQQYMVTMIHGDKATTTLSLSHHPYPPTFNIPIPLTSPSPLPLTSPFL